MRRLWFPVLVFLALCYWAWPYAGAYAIGRAAAEQDAAALAARVNEPALKRSLARQIVAAYLAKSGRADKLGAYGRGLANAVGTSIATPYLDQLLSPEALAALLARGHIEDIKVGDRTIAIAHDVPSLSAMFQSRFVGVLLHSYYDGIASFRFSIPADGESAYGVHVRLSGLTWKLSGLDLPPAVLDRIAADATQRAENKTGS